MRGNRLARASVPDTLLAAAAVLGPIAAQGVILVANREKRAALGHFQPDGGLVSSGAERADRRRLNEAVLDLDRPVHRLARSFRAVVDTVPAAA